MKLDRLFRLPSKRAGLERAGEAEREQNTIPRKGTQIEARKESASDRSTKLTIEESKPIGNGSFGNASRVRVSFESGSRTPEFVIKQFREKDGISGREHAEAALQKFTMLRDAKLQHIPGTFRLVDPPGDEILMTNYNTAEVVALSNNRGTEGSDVQLEEIENLGQVLREIDVDIERATESGIYIAPDAYFVQVPRNGGRVKIKIAIVDIDRVEKSPETRLELYKLNAGSVWHGLGEALRGRFPDNKTYREYYAYLKNWYEKAEDRYKQRHSNVAFLQNASRLAA